MPRSSSRHKSSKHSSRDARDHLDSVVNDCKGNEDKESSDRVLKDSGTSEKRKLDYKDSYGSRNGECVEDYISSKRRKERFEDGVSDRWNGGEDDSRGEGTKKSKERSSESKSRKRVESAGVNVEIDDAVKKSSAKSEGKHRELSSRKEGKEGGAERERNRERERVRGREREKEKERERERKGKDKDGKSERYADIEDLQVAKHVVENADFSTHRLQSPEPENLSERWRRRKRDGSGDGDKHQDDFVDIGDRQMFSKEDVAKDARPRDEKHNDERQGDKYCEDMGREIRYHEGKQKDGCVPRDRTYNRSNDKHFKDEKGGIELRQKKSKPIDLDHDHEQERDHDNKIDPKCDHDHEKYHDRDHLHEHSCNQHHLHECSRNRHRECNHERSHDRERNYDRDCEQKRYQDCDHYWDWDQDGNGECYREWDHDRGQERDYGQDCDRQQYHDGHLDYDGAHIDDQIAKHKDSKGKKSSADDNDEYCNGKSRDTKLNNLDMEKKSVSSSKLESDNDRARSLSCQPLLDDNVSNSRHRTSPSTSSADEYRHIKNEDLNYRDAVTEQRTKTISSRGLTVIAGASERSSKYRSTEKHASLDDVIMGESSIEISSSYKALSVGLVDRSPSSSSLERRYTNRTDARRSFDIEQSGRRSSAFKGAARDLPPAEDRSSQDLLVDKTPVDESTPAGSSVYNRSGQRNSALTPPTGYRGGVGGPYMCALEEDSRMNTGSRYKRTGDPNFARGQGNAWRGAPNWSSPMPNGYGPFQHSPSDGSFRAIIPQFQSPPLFGVRPPMEVNHTGIPYHIPDVDRFPSHLHPAGWQNPMDGPGPSHLHGWDGNNGVYREEMHFYGGGEWEQDRHPMNGRGWETSANMWKGNGDGKMDLPSASLKEAAVVQAPVGDVSTELGGQRSKNESAHEGVRSKAIETKPSVTPSAKEYSKSLCNTTNEKTPDTKMSGHDNVAHVFCAYLSKLDISTELVSPDFYSQCMSLLNIGKSATVDKDTSILVNLKDGGRAVPKTSNTLLSSLPFPAKSNAFCQRAMDIYKKQTWGLGGFQSISGGAANDSLTSKAEEQTLVTDMDKVKDPALNCDKEMTDVPVQNSDKRKEEAVPIASGQKSHDLLSLHSREVHVDANSPLVKMEAPDESLSHDSPEKPVYTVSVDNADWMSSEPLSAKEIRKDCALTSDNMVQAHTSVPTNGHKMDEIDKIEDVNPVCCDGKGQVLDDAMCGSLLFSDGSSKASETLMPGSNESESVIFSRIHHSPECTH